MKILSEKDLRTAKDFDQFIIVDVALCVDIRLSNQLIDLVIPQFFSQILKRIPHLH